MGNNCSCEGEISLGPWGYETGNEWSFRPNQAGAGIKQIIIRYGGVIDSVMFKGGRDDDDDGDNYSTKFGGDGGDKTAKIDINFPSEFLTGISGTYGFFFWTFGYGVASLTFQTNKTKYGPFGSASGTPFSMNANDGVITGFHGRYGRYLEAIGLYIMPICSLSTEVHKEKRSQIAPISLPSFPRSAAAIGGSGGRDWDDGVFSAVKGVHVRLRDNTGIVSAVRFSYLASDGSIVLSPFHGGEYCGGRVRNKTITFGQKDEYLIGVEGFYGPAAEGFNVITSLTFITNKVKYGPVGVEIGTFFTFMNSGDCNGKVMGFHGRSGEYLDAIGLHTEYP